MGRRSTEASLTQNLGEMNLRAGNVIPGNLVFCDQYHSSVLGRRWETRGKEHDRDKFVGGTLYYDSASTVMHCHHQVSTRVGDTIEGKHKVEEFYESIGYPIKAFRADNQIFNSEAFLDDCARSNQTMNFCGVGAHHQNGVAERVIQTVTKWARTIMIDAAIQWPDQADLSLWPMAMDHAVWMWNHLPKENVGLSPLELATNVISDRTELKRLHVWGCPGFVLKPQLQDGKKIPKWTDRGIRGQFLGYSPHHSSNVAMMLNLTSGNISPQFHIVFDDLFETVDSPIDHETNLNVLRELWQRLVHSSREVYHDEDEDPPPLTAEWTPNVDAPD